MVLFLQIGNESSSHCSARYIRLQHKITHSFCCVVFYQELLIFCTSLTYCNHIQGSYDSVYADLSMDHWLRNYFSFFSVYGFVTDLAVKDYRYVRLFVCPFFCCFYSAASIYMHLPASLSVCVCLHLST